MISRSALPGSSIITSTLVKADLCAQGECGEADVAESDEGEHPSGPLPQRETRVLIADDHTILREGLRALLELDSAVTVVGEAADGLEAVRLVGELVPDVVILDITMPHMNGIEAARRISKRFPSVRIIMLSMHATTEYIHRAFDCGAAAYLVKDTTGDEVISAMKSVMEGRRYVSARLADAVTERRRSKNSSPLESLSAREREVLQLVVEGHSSTAIARTLQLSSKTVETYRARILQKLGVAGVVDLVKFAIEHGLTPSA